jgi:pescadillo
MARIKKKGQAGAAKNYITRNQAIKKLQLSLPDFRKLCIWKGIYPREPRSRKKAHKSSTNSTTFYYARDIQYLLHEPLIQKFRDQKVLEKKISKALGRGDVSDAKRLDSNAKRPEKTGKPSYTLDHVIRERYPTFIDALRDLDDCLSMLFLFANLPSTSTVPAKMIARCERLCLEFEHYLILSQSLRKSFLSIKGIYYQANILGEDILWLVPYKFNQRVVGDVDFRIMGTFVEFYMTLLGFVNFRLYTSIGLKYPPKFDQTKDDKSAELAAFTLEGKGLGAEEEQKQITDGSTEHQPDPDVQAAVDEVIRTLDALPAAEDGANGDTNKQNGADDQEQESTDAIDRFEPAAPGGDVLPQPEYTGANPGSCFRTLLSIFPENRHDSRWNSFSEHSDVSASAGTQCWAKAHIPQMSSIQQSRTILWIGRLFKSQQAESQMVTEKTTRLPTRWVQINECRAEYMFSRSGCGTQSTMRS